MLGNVNLAVPKNACRDARYWAARLCDKRPKISSVRIARTVTVMVQGSRGKLPAFPVMVRVVDAETLKLLGSKRKPGK